MFHLLIYIFLGVVVQHFPFPYIVFISNISSWPFCISVGFWNKDFTTFSYRGNHPTNMGTFSKEVFLSADAELLGVGANEIHFVAFLGAILWYHCTSLSYMAAPRARNQFSAITDGSRSFTFRSIWLVSVPATYPIIYNHCTALS